MATTGLFQTTQTIQSTNHFKRIFCLWNMMNFPTIPLLQPHVSCKTKDHIDTLNGCQFQSEESANLLDNGPKDQIHRIYIKSSRYSRSYKKLPYFS